MTTTSTVRRRTALLAVLVLVAGIGLAACGDDDEGTGSGDGTIEITGAWARPSAMVASAGAAYMVITNEGDADDALLSASVPASVAGTAEVHETRAAMGGGGMGDGGMGDDDGEMGDGEMGGEMDGDTTSTAPMMEMVEVDRIDIAAGATAVLEPGGYHVMLLDLVEPLEDGMEIEITLTFEVAGEIVVVAIVGDGPP